MISVVTYNLLTQPYSQSHCVPNNDKNVLNQEYRYQLIKDQIQCYMKNSPKPLFCFQELNQSLFNYLHPFINQNGYEMVYAPYDSKKSDFMGVAIAYSNQEYIVNKTQIKRLVDHKKWVPQQKSYFISLLSYSIQNWICKKNSYQLAQIRQNKVISLELQQKNSQKNFCITNYHMPCAFYDPQIMNIHVLLLSQLSQDFAQNNPNILCGDFNIQPDSSSYKIFSEGQIENSHADYPIIPSQDKWVMKIQKFKSAYKEYFGEEPLLTNCAKMIGKEEKFEGCLDYIFYNDQFIVDKVDKIFEEKPQLLPNSTCPSDHLPIFAKFKFI